MQPEYMHCIPEIQDSLQSHSRRACSAYIHAVKLEHLTSLVEYTQCKKNEGFWKIRFLFALRNCVLQKKSNNKKKKAQSMDVHDRKSSAI